MSELPRDNEGYLLDPADWSEEFADAVAIEENIVLDDHHWLVILFIRDYFDDRQTVPETRHALKYLKEQVGKEQGTRGYLYSLFPYGYGQQACKIAGMRKPLKLMLDV
ncbi:MAG: TusE/DsrC/DsvC family sulfur relay protein [Gammaproteobacteria bacterium]|nr:TusE/DsrC/DsvC family sulfur relay protein [Gammaproteobacteria bacterium]